MKNKTKDCWNDFAESYSATFHTEKIINRIIKNPVSAFDPATWRMINNVMPDLNGKKICVPSSGDNHAVFAFALLGAEVTSCDISENQLSNAKRVAKKHGWNIQFICSDTMKLDNINSNEYDFVYTSNGVHVWINDLPSMYKNIHRIMRKEGVYVMYEIHPFQRPFDGKVHDKMVIEKAYDCTGPFENETEITFAWRMQDIMNAMLDSGLSISHIEEILPQKNYEEPFWISLSEQVAGVTATKEEVDRMYDYKTTPILALPEMISIVARK